MGQFVGGYSYWHLYHYITDKAYLPQSTPETKRTKRSAEPSSLTDLIPNEIFERNFAEVIAQDEISIIVFADTTSSLTRKYYPIYKDIEKSYSDVKIYTIDCLYHRNYNICFDEIVNGLPLINFYQKGKKIVEDFPGSKFNDFQYQITKVNKT